MILLILINLIAYVAAQPNICTSNGGYTANSPYSVNLNAITTTLSQNIPAYGYYAASITALTIPETVNAFALCRADQTPSQCTTCVNPGGPNLLSICQNNRQGVIWYDGCLIRYTDAALHQPTSSIQFVLTNGYDAANTAQFKVDRDGLIADLQAKAAGGGLQVKAGAGTKSTTSIGSESSAIYGLVQCTPDLSAADCQACLAAATQSLQQCCDFKTGVRVLKPDCTIQYETSTFYNQTRLSERGLLLP